MDEASTARRFDRELLAALPAVRTYARRLRQPQDVEDLVQETIVRALRFRDTYQIGTNMVAWLCFIARNRNIEIARRESRKLELTDEMAASLVAPEDQHDRLETQQILRRLDCLPARLRTAVEASMLGKSHEEASRELGTSREIHKANVFRGRQLLRQAVGAAEVADPDPVVAKVP